MCSLLVPYQNTEKNCSGGGGSGEVELVWRLMMAAVASLHFIAP